MDVRPHDLLRLDSPDAVLVEAPSPPEWVIPALTEAPWVVVRRARAARGLIPIGVRGWTRGERYATCIPASAIRERVTPEAIVAARAWETAARRLAVPALSALAIAAERFDALPLDWGPTGGVGFELTTGRPVLGPDSDVDLVLRHLPVLAEEIASVLAAINRLPTRFDIQVETPLGTIALSDLTGASRQVLVRTANGPRLVDRPQLAGQAFP